MGILNTDAQKFEIKLKDMAKINVSVVVGGRRTVNPLYDFGIDALSSDMSSILPNLCRRQEEILKETLERYIGDLPVVVPTTEHIENIIGQACIFKDRKYKPIVTTAKNSFYKDATVYKEYYMVCNPAPRFENGCMALDRLVVFIHWNEPAPYNGYEL